jgi:transcriptional regulator with XRE-family HTH domain
MLPVLKTAERLRARQLRAQGWSVKEIERELKVSRASVSLWVRDVPLDERRRAILALRTRMGPLIAGERKAARAREVRRSYQEHGRRLARESDASYAAGCMLYWAEGSKSRNVAQVVNSDPELLASPASSGRTSTSHPSQCGFAATSSPTISSDNTRSRSSGSRDSSFLGRR